MTKSTRNSSNKWTKNLVPRLFTSYRKLLYDCDIYICSQKKKLLATPYVEKKKLLGGVTQLGKKKKCALIKLSRRNP